MKSRWWIGLVAMASLLVFSGSTAVGASASPRSAAHSPRDVPAPSHPATTDNPARDYDYYWSSAPVYNGLQVPFRCSGNGTSGYRWQVVYAHVDGAPDVLSAHPEDVLAAVATADDSLEHSSNGERSVRWVQGKDCSPTFVRISVTPEQLEEGDRTGVLEALHAEQPGLFVPKRDLLVLVDSQDAAGDCGSSDEPQDFRHGAVNKANTGTQVSVVWEGCWVNSTVAHELGHSMGAVQTDVPHYDTDGHCSDGADIMCHDPSIQQKYNHPYVCGRVIDPILFDCNHDDYYNLNPARGSFLARHWNLADDRFLIDAPRRVLPTLPSTPGNITAVLTDPTHVYVSWSPSSAAHGGITRYEVWLNPLSQGTAEWGTDVTHEDQVVYYPDTRIDVPVSATSYDLTIPNPGIVRLTVVAINDSGYSWVTTPPVTVGTDLPPRPVTNVTYTLPAGSQTPVVTWQGGDSNVPNDPTVGCYVIFDAGQTEDNLTPEKQRAGGDYGSTTHSLTLYYPPYSGDHMVVACLDAAGRTDSAPYINP